MLSKIILKNKKKNLYEYGMVISPKDLGPYSSNF